MNYSEDSINEMVRQQMDYLNLESKKAKQMHIDGMHLISKIKSMELDMGIRGTISSVPPVTTVVDSYTTTRLAERYFNNLDAFISNSIRKDIEILVADILEFCSDDEVDDLIARITSDSEYLSRKGYNSINLKGD
jgi:hypothetical protein